MRKEVINLYEEIENTLIDISVGYNLDFMNFVIEGPFKKPNWTNDREPINGVEKMIDFYIINYKDKYFADIDEEDAFYYKTKYVTHKDDELTITGHIKHRIFELLKSQKSLNKICKLRRKVNV